MSESLVKVLKGNRPNASSHRYKLASKSLKAKKKKDNTTYFLTVKYIFYHKTIHVSSPNPGILDLPIRCSCIFTWGKLTLREEGLFRCGPRAFVFIPALSISMWPMFNSHMLESQTLATILQFPTVNDELMSTRSQRANISPSPFFQIGVHIFSHLIGGNSGSKEGDNDSRRSLSILLFLPQLKGPCLLSSHCTVLMKQAVLGSLRRALAK